MSKKFIDQYILLQKIGIIFSEEKDSVIELINHFSPDEELNELIGSIKTIPIDLKQDTVLIHNFFDLISDDEFIAKLNATHKKKISQSLFELLLESTEDIKIYELLRYWLSVIFRKYGEFIEDSQALKLYSQQILLETSPHLFLNYFRKPGSESEYFHSLLFELEKTDEGSVTRYSVHKEDITFILSNQDLLNDFIQYITDSRNIEKTIDLLRQRGKSYSGENEDGIEFIKLINDLSDEQTKHFERFIFSFISKYFEVRYSQEYRYGNIEDILRSDLFHSLLIKIASSNSDFFTKIMNLFDDTDKFIQGPLVDVITYSMTENDVEYFTECDLIKNYRWTFFDVYFTLQKSSHPEKTEILGKLETLKKDWIEENTNAIEKRKEQEELSKEKENAENRKMIDEVLEAIASPEFKFSQKILFLFEKYPDLFISPERDILKDQIRIMLSDTDFFDIKNSAEIHYSEEQKNSFIRPSYMSYGTLDKCYEIGKQLGIDIIGEYADVYIYYLPFAYNPKFFDEIQTLNPDHIKYLVNAYSLERDKIDDLRIFHPYRFFEVVEKFTSLFEESDHWKRSIENLVGLLTIDNDRFGIGGKKQIIHFLANYLPEEFFLEGITKIIGQNNLGKYHYFNDFLSGKIGDSEDNLRYQLWSCVNDVLCSKFNHTGSIERRFNQLQTVNLVLERMPSGVAYGVTKLRSEIDGFRDERRFTAALSAVSYPDFYENIIVVLKHSFEFDQDTNQVSNYLQKFAYSYLEKISEDIKIDKLLELKTAVDNEDNSKKFLQRYFPRLLSQLGYDKLELYQSKDSYSELQKKFILLTDENRQLKQDSIRFDSSIILVVEGKTDKSYIERAYYEIYGTDCPYRIIIAGGCNQMIGIIGSYIEDYYNAKICFLVDWDHAGIKIWDTDVLKEYITDNKLDSRQEGFICERTGLYARKHSDLNYHILLLPIVRDFSSLVLKKEVVTSGVTQVEDSGSILDRTYKKASNHPIECLLFNREVFDQGGYVIDGASYFQKRELVGGSEVIVSCMTPAQKIRFRDIVLSDMALSPNRNNFKPIFEYINNNTNIG